ncbi:protein eva-1 isoform X3 [Cimex lectularius]|uniref:SUEL-type lectin domain-containing protein n=1 Tax=Cimex lectularius TaxID=79782 RepID=A0A8I6RU93_CIMLE|nr:protein eva-1 isoform X3 [Cimex lectularius]
MMRRILTLLLLAANFVLLAFCDNLGTLRRYEKAACEDESLALSCPQGTSISVEIAQYGINPRAASTLCPPPIPAISQTSPCTPPNGLQYSLLQTVVEACQKKRQCKFQTSTKSFGGDPCPGVQKYVLVAYKCRPYEFRSKIACENEVVQLNCNPNSRIAVYSASYGRTEYESVQCPQTQGVPEETCLVSYATETVMQICHGKRRCTLSADAATFGSPCRKDSRMYLKVVYTCVPRKVLREQYEERPEEDEMLLVVDDDTEYDSIDEDNSLLPSPNLAGRHNTSYGLPATGSPKRRPDSSSMPPVGPKPGNRTFQHGSDDTKRRLCKVRKATPVPPPNEIQNDFAGFADENASLINCTLTIVTSRDQRIIGVISHWINTYHFLSKNKERLILYLIVSAGAGLVCILCLVIGRLAWNRRKAAKRTEEQDHATQLPRPFTDDLSEVENDIDLTLATPVALMHHHSPPAAEVRSQVVRFSGDDTVPRSLSRSGPNSQYYYG